MVVKQVYSYRLNSLDETLVQLNKESCFIIAGGTDVMVQKKHKRGVPAKIDQPIMFIDHLPELRKIYRQDNDLHIGACGTYSGLLEHPLIPEILKMAMREIAAPAIRNRGTLGGNICNASPAGDTLPVLYILNAKLLLKSADGERVVDIKDFIQGPRRVKRLANELLAEIILPGMPEQAGTYFMFEKVANRRADAISKISFAGLLRPENGRVADARFAFGAVGPTMVRSAEIEKNLINQPFPLSNEMIGTIIADLDSLIQPIDDQRSTANYRKKVALNLAKYFFQAKERS